MRLSDHLAYLKWIPSLMLSILAICFPSRRILWNISLFENNLNSFCLACFVAYQMNQYFWAMDRSVYKILFCAIWCTLETDIILWWVNTQNKGALFYCLPSQYLIGNILRIFGLLIIRKSPYMYILRKLLKLFPSSVKTPLRKEAKIKLIEKKPWSLVPKPLLVSNPHEPIRHFLKTSERLFLCASYLSQQIGRDKIRHARFNQKIR